MTTLTTATCSAGLGALVLFLATAATAQDAPAADVWAPTIKLSGRIYFDSVDQEVDREAGADAAIGEGRLRTARLALAGNLNSKWTYKAEASISSQDQKPQWEDLLLTYKVDASTSIIAGNFRTVSFENISSSLNNTFMERGPFNDIIDAGRVMNLVVRRTGPNWTLQAAVSGDTVNTGDTITSEQVAYSVRGTWAPAVAEGQALHLGFWARARDRGEGPAFNYRVRNNTNYGARYTSTGAIGDGDAMIGLEGLWILGPLSLQGEAVHIAIDRTNGLDQNAAAYYVAASWFVTGESRKLDVGKGAIGRTKVLSPVTSGGPGAIELAARYDRVDLTDISGPAAAGQYSAWTLGANWYPLPHVRFMGNFTRSRNDNPAVGADVDVDTLQFRAQFDF